MRIIVRNERHPMELQIVEKMLRENNLVPKRVASVDALFVEIPSQHWFKNIKLAVEAMTTCQVILDLDGGTDPEGHEARRMGTGALGPMD